MRYPIARPDLSGNELAYVTEALQSTWISSTGPFLTRFEEAVARAAGAAHAVAAANGTVALHLALAGLDIGPGDEVIVPSLTFVASANAVSYCGATPVFADCDAQSWCVDPESVARLITPRTRAVVAVPLLGQACDYEALQDLTRQHDLFLIEDAAESLGAAYDDRPVGSFGDVATFSFYGNKTVTTGEGGMVVTRDAALAGRMRWLSHHAMDPKRRYWHSALGYNYRLTNVAAAIGLAQMERLDQFLARRRALAQSYTRLLQTVDGVTLPVESPRTRHAHWMYGVLLREPRWLEPVRRELLEQGIETRPFFHPLHHLPMYRACRTDGGCPRACSVSARGVWLPTSALLADGDATVITRCLRESLALRVGAEVTRRADAVRRAA